MNERYKHDIDNYGQILDRNSIVCPYCGYEHELNGDYFEYSHEFEDEDFECNGCEQFFKVYGVVEYEYWATTTPLPKYKRG